MEKENFGEFIRELRATANMPLRKLAAILDIDQSTLSKLERGERPTTRRMIPILAETFGLDEKKLIVRFMSQQLVSQLEDEEYANEIINAVKREVAQLNKK